MYLKLNRTLYTQKERILGKNAQKPKAYADDNGYMECLGSETA